MSDMTTVITGASGFLGRYLIKELLDIGAELVLVGRRSGQISGFPVISTDYSVDSLTEYFRGVDAVVHLASTRGVFENLSAYYDCIDITENVYRAAALCNVKNIVYASSISVYSGTDLPYKETQIAAPGNMYGVQKLTCEQLGRIYGIRHGLKVKNLRFAHLYGANEQNNYMINIFFRKAFAREQLQVFAKNNARRQMLYAKDAARAVVVALKHPSLEGNFNIGCPDVLTNSEIAETICRVFSPENKVLYGDQTENTSSSYMDGTKTRELLHFEPQYTFEEAVKEIYKDMLLIARSGE